MNSKFHTSEKKIRGFFDFETWEWVNPLCFGAVINKSGLREEHFIIDFQFGKPGEKWAPDKVAEDSLKWMYQQIENEEVSEFWAHNAGRFDALILSAAARRLEWFQEGTLAGGNRLICLALRPHSSGPWLKIFDTWALVPAKLKSIAEDFELPSRKIFTDEDYSIDARLWPADKLRRGCLADCHILSELLDSLESIIGDWGGAIKATFSSSALSVIKSHLKTTSETLPKVPITINEEARSAYYGARVEIFAHKPRGWLIEYDVCSSYPWSMTQSLPWKAPVKVGKRGCDKMLEGSTEGVIFAIVNVQEMAIPSLPYKDSNDGIYFPTGEWKAWFPANELRYAIALGIQVLPLEGIAFSSRIPFSSFIQNAYALKSTATGALRQFAKLILNGAYGKFGQKPEHSLLKVFPSEAEAKEYVLTSKNLCSNIDECALAVNFERWPPHTHYALAGYITGYSRILLHKALLAAKCPAYCDTDSVHCESLKWPENIGTKLGQLKIELPKYKGEFYAPKIYRLVEPDGKFHMASKGFPVRCENCASSKPKTNCKQCWKQFDKIINQDSILRHRIRLLKSQLKAGGTTFRRLSELKKWHGFSMKRKPLGEEKTRPWTVKELEKEIHRNAKSPLVKD